MANRKTEMITFRLDRWMVDGIDISLEYKDHITRTDWLKNVIADALVKEGITQAAVRARKGGTDNG